MSPRPCRAPISTVAVKAGQAVKAGDVLLTIEAMKMETALHAPRDGTVAGIAGRRPAPRSTPRICSGSGAGDLIRLGKLPHQNFGGRVNARSSTLAL